MKSISLQRPRGHSALSCIPHIHDPIFYSLNNKDSTCWNSPLDFKMSPSLEEEGELAELSLLHLLEGPSENGIENKLNH